MIILPEFKLIFVTEQVYSMTVTNFSWVIPDKLAGSALPGKPMLDEESMRRDIGTLAESGVTVLVSLAKPPDCIDEICKQFKIIWLCFPIADFSVPDNPVLFDSLIKNIVEYINNGHKVCIHCYAGVGRTGLVLTCVVGKLYSLNAQKAIAAVRRSRSAIDTMEQESFVISYLGEYE
jgi:hypothetical protein